MNKAVRIGFLGAGSIAKSHAYALDTMKYYYPDARNIEKVVVATRTRESREPFAEAFGFSYIFLDPIKPTHLSCSKLAR